MFTKHQMVRFSYNADNYDLRGKVVSIVRTRAANSFDVSRVVVRLVNTDGSLGQEYQVRPDALIAL